LLAGFIAGLCELFTDASGQYVVHSLFYPIGEPMLWTSPLYMPLSWMVILTHLGYGAWRLRGLWGWRKAALVCGMWGAIQIPLYEEMAYYAHWWRYKPTHLMSCCLKVWSSLHFPCSMIVSNVERGRTLSSLVSSWEHGCPLPHWSRGCSLDGRDTLALKVL
jgi:hypothetical protein